MTEGRSRYLPRYLGLALVSGCVLALQVIFTRIFSIMIWHHFTYLVIGVALLGGGASGTFLAVRQWDNSTIKRRIGLLAVAFSCSILVDLLIISIVQFDPLRARDFVATLIGLTVYFVALFTTFFLGGLTVASAFSLWTKDTHRLYFADLFGAGISTLLVVAVVQSFGGPGAIVLVALLALVGAFLLGVGLPRRWKPALWLFAGGQLALLAWVSLANPIQLPVPESKDLGWALRWLNVSSPEYTRWNPVARVDVLPLVEVDEPMIVGGVSSTYLQSEDAAKHTYPLRLVTLDGTSMTGLYEFDGDLSRFEFLKHAIISAPFVANGGQPSTLNIGVGGGLDIILARLYDAKAITAIELNADVVELLTDTYADFTGRLADDPRTRLVTAEGRSFLTRDTSRYDIIQGIGLDNVAALSGGAYVLSESYLYTVDSMELALDRLTPQGIFSWTRDDTTPPREMLRLTGLAVEALRRLGVTNVAEHIAIVANESNRTATLLVSRSPFTTDAIERLRNWAAENEFNILHDPYVRMNTTHADYLYAPDQQAFEATYPYNVYPVSDDNPFFYNYFKWSNLFTRAENASSLTRFPLGNMILIAMLSLTTITAIAFVVFPLFRYKRNGLQTPYAVPMLAFFSALGLGYIFVEIVLIQRFTLFIGYPTHAITLTIFSMLTFSALGSLFGQPLLKTSAQLRGVLLAIGGLICLYVLGLPIVFRSLLHLPDVWRMASSVLLIAPLALLMGIPFPTGLRQLGRQAQGLVPWAWGLNGIFSVLGSVLVILVSMLSNFTTALLVAAAFYATAAALAGRLWKARVVEAPAPEPATRPIGELPALGEAQL